MKIGLLDVDGHNFPNLPLMKISAYHKARGDDVDWVNLFEHYDRVYQSKVFTFTADFEYFIDADEIQKGGTGYGLNNSLPCEIEHCYPDYGLYPEYKEAYGFLTRGCPRACKFCIVSEKEGRKSVKAADLDEFWKGQHTIKLLDPNLLACREHKELLQQLIDSRAYIDFTQGLDIRLVNDSNFDLICKCKVKMIHFAWDNPEERNIIEKFKSFKKLSGIDMRKLRVYVLTNFNSTHEQDLYRVYKLKEMGYDPYIMVYNKESAPRITRHLQRWVNNKYIFRSVDKFEDYLSRVG